MTDVIKADTYALDKPQEVLSLASLLKQHIKDNKLTSKIQGKDFVNVEGWQFAGAMLGLSAIVTDLTDLSTDAEIKYRATVTVVRVGTGEQVGSGFALCSNKEGSKRRFDEYAIASMAQTRAVGKAYRNLLAWVIKAAGYEATPAEEMDFQHDETTATAAPKPAQKPESPTTPAETMPPIADYAGREGEYPLPAKLQKDGMKIVSDVPEKKLAATGEWAAKNGYPDLAGACKLYTLPF